MSNTKEQLMLDRIADLEIENSMLRTQVTGFKERESLNKQVLQRENQRLIETINKMRDILDY